MTNGYDKEKEHTLFGPFLPPAAWKVDGMAGAPVAFLNYEGEATYQVWWSYNGERTWVPEAMEHHICFGLTLFQTSFATQQNFCFV